MKYYPTCDFEPNNRRMVVGHDESNPMGGMAYLIDLDSMTLVSTQNVDDDENPYTDFTELVSEDTEYWCNYTSDDFITDPKLIASLNELIKNK